MNFREGRTDRRERQSVLEKYVLSLLAEANNVNAKSSVCVNIAKPLSVSKSYEKNYYILFINESVVLFTMHFYPPAKQFIRRCAYLLLQAHIL